MEVARLLLGYRVRGTWDGKFVYVHKSADGSGFHWDHNIIPDVESPDDCRVRLCEAFKKPINVFGHAIDVRHPKIVAVYLMQPKHKQPTNSLENSNPIPYIATMKATIPLSHAEIQQAISEFVEREGWVVSGTPAIAHKENDGPMGGITYTATVTVEPPTRAKRSKAE